MLYQLNISDVKVPKYYFGFIFKTIFPNGKIYIGQTQNKIDRCYFGSGSLAKQLIKEFGKNNLKREILKFVNNINQLNAWESIMIKKFNSCDLDIGCNILSGAPNNARFGRTMKNSESVRNKLRGNTHTLGFKHSSDSIDKIRKARIFKIEGDSEPTSVNNFHNNKMIFDVFYI
jgi:hypothetical protein